MTSLEKFMRHLALRPPITIEVAMGILGDVWKWVVDRLSEPEVRARQLRSKTEQLREFLAEDRSRATDRAVFKGRALLELRALNGPAGWDQLLASLGICRRTAQNLVALAAFAHRSPEVFNKLKRLGPTKLYRLARLSPEALENLRLDAEVPTERGSVRFGNLTDLELEVYLRKIHPPKIRTTGERLKVACRSMRRLIENLPKGARPPRQDLETIRDVARDVSLRVMDLLGPAA